MGGANRTFYDAVPCQELINSWDMPQGEKHALIAEIEVPNLQLCPEIDEFEIMRGSEDLEV